MNQDCNTIMDPVLLGYDTLQSGSQFSISIDITTAMVAIGVNSGKYNYVKLQIVSGSPTRTIPFNGLIYTLNQYVDYFYPVSIIIYNYIII